MSLPTSFNTVRRGRSAPRAIALAVAATLAATLVPALASGPASADPSADPSAESSAGRSADLSAASTDATALGERRVVRLKDDWSSKAATEVERVRRANAGSALGARKRRFTPTSGVMFNNPLGAGTDQRTLVDFLIANINASPKGSLIKMAVFSFADPSVADALVAAYQRGVRVKLVVSGDRNFPAVRRAQKVLGTDANKKSFAIACVGSCRGPKGGQMHAKYFSFSDVGTAQFVTVVGSVNITEYNAQRQWNDLYTVANDKTYYMAYNRWFNQLKKDLEVVPSFRRRVAGLNQIEMTPMNLAFTADPVLDAMSRIRCLVPMVEIDPTYPDPTAVVQTRVLLSAHAWNGERGKSIAFRVAELARSGCAVQVLYGVGTGSAVTSILAGGGVVLNAGTHQGIRTHQKVMIVQGGFDGLPRTSRAWTGSHNWSDRALNRDDLIVQIGDPAYADQYVYLFDQMWAQA